MKAVLLCDFGSTYTKLSAVSLADQRVLGCASAFTTVETDIENGFREALAKLSAKTGPLDIEDMKACSSAAGGLRMAVSGLVPELTASAARMAALGAGAKVIKVFSHELTCSDISEIDRLAPDIFLLTGGTDGGNRDCILHNAAMLTTCRHPFPTLIAGNRSAADELSSILASGGREYLLSANVMPKLGALNIQPAQAEIRALFLREIIKAKGLSKISKMISDILMPTPAAVLSAITLLADGVDGKGGIGELLAVDPGGATTDVYSVAHGLPDNERTILKGLAEPYIKRTVEGDIGMRYSLDGIIEEAGLERVAEIAGIAPERVSELCEELRLAKDQLPDTAERQALDDALASLAVEIAVSRHCGRIEEVYTPLGKAYAQSGKDLRKLKNFIVTGGALISSPHTREIARFAAWKASDPLSLRPLELNVLVDRSYILSAMGVLAQENPEAALNIMKKELAYV